MRILYILVIGLIIVIGCISFLHKGGGAAPSQSETLAQQWGIEVQGIRLSAAGHLLDFRYRVVDAEKAAPLLDRRIKAQLIHQPTQKVLAVPNTAKVGPLRQTVKYGKPRVGTIYFVLFGNTGGFLKAGHRVTVVIGDFRLEDVIVE